MWQAPIGQRARILIRRSWAALAATALMLRGATGAAPLLVGFAEADITPKLEEGRPVYLAGYLPGRRATGIHDRLTVQCVVLSDGKRHVAVASLDVIGLQMKTVQRIREKLNDFDHVAVMSTHNHAGPDVIGIWGKSFFRSGIDPRYIDRVVRDVVETIRTARKRLRQVTARFGTAADERLVGDSRLPVVKDSTIRVLRFDEKKSRRCAGLLVQWNCHPEALGLKMTELTSDFPGVTRRELVRRFGGPVVYVSGAVGGLMAPPGELESSSPGERPLRRGSFEFMERYGRSVADLAAKAVAAGELIELTPFQWKTEQVMVPVRNVWYRAARLAGVVRRKSYEWTGDPTRRGEPMRLIHATRLGAIETEVGYFRLGELGVACIPGEIYPELVYGKICDPAPEGADFPKAEKEPSVVDVVPDARWMLWGLANDEIGYLIPERQWDARSPFAFGRKRSQYGEVNSCGPDAASVVLHSLSRCVAGVTGAATGRLQPATASPAGPTSSRRASPKPRP